MNRLYVCNENQWKNVCTRKYLSDKELQVITIDKGIVLPSTESEKTGVYGGGVCDGECNFIAGFLRNGEDCQKDPGYYGINSSYFVNDMDITYLNENVVFGGVIVGHFGHFILESMGRLWYLLKHDTLNTRIVFTTVLGQKNGFGIFLGF